MAGHLVNRALYNVYNVPNRDKWISHGLWSVVRHPNYLGEIILWIGLYISASSTFTEVNAVLTAKDDDNLKAKTSPKPFD